MNALITGGGGFVGQWLGKALLAQGFEVYAAGLGSALDQLGVLGGEERTAVHWVTADMRGTDAVDRAVERVRQLDRDAAAHRDRVAATQLANCRRLASWLHREGRLAEPWTVQSGTDMLYALISSDLIEALTVDRHWSTRRLARHLATMFQYTFTSRPDVGMT